MGSDYYGSNEHWVPAEGPIQSAGPVFGYAILARQYYDRYHLPIMLTETNSLGSGNGPDWLRHQWACIRELRRVGIPVMGFTWYSLLDQVDWDMALREVNGTENPVGLYDLNRRPHPVRDAYRDLIAEWRDEMPMEVRYGSIHVGIKDGAENHGGADRRNTTRARQVAIAHTGEKNTGRMRPSIVWRKRRSCTWAGCGGLCNRPVGSDQA